MAIDFSASYVERSRKNLPWELKLQIKLAPWIKRVRLLRLKAGSKRVHPNAVVPRITEELEKSAVHFQKERWAFVENIFTPDFYKEFLARWPTKRYLEPPRAVEKSYNTGFRWVYGDKPDFAYSDPYGQYLTLRVLLEYLRSAEVAHRVTAFAGADKEMALYSFILTDAGSGAEVIPHKDSINDDSRAEYNLNCIFFIDASEGRDSGGLTLSRDNELKDRLFEPTKLKNTCLIYDILGDFYHGFPPIAKGKWRWVVTAQFCQRNYVTHQKEH
ncbi:MAG: hypothetical protein Q7R93_03330 [bacterium]|nr:hypothetical protein [bacterium]